MISLKENIVSDMRTLQKAVRHNFGPHSQKNSTPVVCLQ